MSKKAETSETVLDVSIGRVEVHIIGESPLIMNAMSEKSRRGLLLPAPAENKAQKQSRPKHDPYEEFKGSCYYARDPEFPTLLVHKATAFKKAIMGAALDTPGQTKSQIGRLLYVVGDEVPIFGVPEIMLCITRSADINRTPDVRTRAIIPVWYTTFQIEHAYPLIQEKNITKLITIAGITQGVGDWRVEKGSGNYGRFSIVNPDDPRIEMIKKHGGRDAQAAALNNPVPYDSESTSLLEWFDVERANRFDNKQDQEQEPKKGKKGNAK